jgi:hypothetical protein
MGVFQRRYPDGRVSKDWYIDYRVHGKHYKRKIGPNKKLAEQVLHDLELKLARGDHLGIHEARKILFADFAAEYLQFAQSGADPPSPPCDLTLPLLSSRWGTPPAD